MGPDARAEFTRRWKVSGIIFDAGPKNSPVLLQAGTILSLLGDPGAADDPFGVSGCMFSASAALRLGQRDGQHDRRYGEQRDSG